MTTTTTAPAIHRFEAAGLGKAPFRVAGMEIKKYQACPGAPVQPGSSCDYCGQGITEVWHIDSADGRSFKVGCECVRKTGDRGLKKAMNPLLTKKRHDSADARIAKAVDALKTPAVRDALAKTAHPLTWRAERGDTLLDWAEWMLKNAGRKGKVDVARLVEGLAA